MGLRDLAWTGRPADTGAATNNRVSAATSPVVSLVRRAKASAWGGAISSSSLRATGVWRGPLAQPAMRARCSGGS